MYVPLVDQGLLKTFLIEIHHQAKVGLSAYALIGSAMKREDGVEMVWLGVGALLGAAANVSKIVRLGERRPPRQELVERLRIDPATSPLADRAIRNHLEHIDERIETWWKRSTKQNFVHTIHAPDGRVPGLAIEDTFRGLDPQTTKVCFHGDQVSCLAIANELFRIKPLSDTWDS